MTIHPRKVRGGIRIAWAGVGEPDSWVARRILELARSQAAPEDYAEGLDYARRGQTKTAEITGTLASALVQGRADRPYVITIRFRSITDSAWQRAADTMAGQAIYAARLLTGEVPDQLDSLFVASETSLVPAAEELEVACSCGESSGWCKHACCLCAIIADRIDQRPFLIFELRGQQGEALLDALRQRSGQAELDAIATPVYEAHVPDAPSARGLPLDECMDGFWDAGLELDSIPTPMSLPSVSHPLLRRLGPSPFKEWRFPLVGLLATCFNIISEANLDPESTEGPDEGLDEGPDSARSPNQPAE